MLRWWCLLQIIGVLAFASLTIFAAVQHFKRKNMYIVPIAWLYVAFMMAVAEATSTQGTVLGAFFTFVLYGLMPIGLLLYFMGTPGRRRKRLAREAEETEAYLAAQATNLAQTAQSIEPAQLAQPPQGMQAVQAAQPPVQDSPALAQTNTGDLPPGDLVAPIRKEP